MDCLILKNPQYKQDGRLFFTDKMTSTFKRVYVISPANTATGGTEALVTLCRALRDLNVDAYMFYTGAHVDVDPVPPRFQHFNLPRVDTIPDDAKSIVVIPESYTEFVHRFKKSTRAIWWLSVDNYFPKLPFLGPRTIWHWLCKAIHRFRRFNDHSVLHLCQSYYAKNFVLMRGGKNIQLLMDYLGEEHLKDNFSVTERDDVILYNPMKGAKFTQKLIGAANNRFRFVALTGMTPKQVHEWCLKAKVYIDFGSHPGKDRFPREAVMAGCVVITSRRGSAAYYEDVPIPSTYKFEDNESNISQILGRIAYCLENYSSCLPDFDYYRDDVRSDKGRFLNQVKEVFLKD